ncbi:MAG TPA: fibronectin type III domain-containing protein, partial [Silvibacterium sp.]|nr:fibronectin type III domain-containing protein [Silvibacterium sp.]
SVVSGSPRLMTYTVELPSPSGHNAGPSNPAITAAGAAPPPVDDLTATARPDGILLRWRPAGGNEILRIHRVLVATRGAAKPSQASGSATPPEQTLEVTGTDRGEAIDRDAALDHTYSYSAEREEKVTIENKTFEVLSAPGQAVTIDARDIFPPAVPRDLQAVADPEAHAIDLSWLPDTESDIAGYIVYRRDAASNAAAVRISAPGEVAPAFRDANARLGHRYAYSVSAVDRDGNESPRSAEAEEGLPQP